MRVVPLKLGGALVDVDRAGTDELARQAVSVAQALRDSADPIRRLRFSGAVSGRDYAEHGAALASALAVLNSRLTGGVPIFSIRWRLGCPLRLR